MISNASRWWLALFLALATLLPSGCGRKTLPIPPHEAVPDPIGDLQYRQDDNRVTLTWTYPKRTTAGTEITGLHSFIIQRAVVPEKDYCPGCPQTFTSTIEIEAATAITDAKTRQARYTETILRPGHRYLYKVQSKAGWRLVSDDSNTIAFFWDSPPMASEELMAEAGDGKALLRWQPVSKLVNSDAIAESVQYQVYRGRTAETMLPVGELVSATTHTDSGLSNGETYLYQIRAVRQVNGSRLIGLASQTATVTPRDLTPPAPPHGLTAVLIEGGVKLLWERSTEKDLAGYRIFRRLPSESMLSYIGEVDRGASSFLDAITEAPDGCSWAITAFDKAIPANESAISQELYHEPF